MRPAPPVTTCCDGGPLWPGLHAALGALAAAVVALWLGGLLQGLLQGLVQARGLVLAGAVAAAAGLGGSIAWRLAPQPPRLLSWDGHCWRSDGLQGRLDVMIDLGPWMLLRLRPQDGAAVHWLPVSASQGSEAWHALRAAVYSRPPEATPDASAVQRLDRAPD